MTKKYSMTIGGEAVAADDYTPIRNPANTDEIVGLAPVGTAAHLDQAVAAARSAYSSWRRS
jgi:acyl-CoA reductase-like NAD-dependent aldehyde dehydrogenase